MTTAVSEHAFITEDMPIGDIVLKYPEIIDDLQAIGVHCVGCHSATYEPLGEGLRGHGMSDRDVYSAIHKLNETVKKYAQTKKESEGSFTFTESAAKKAIEFMKQEQKEGYFLRFAVTPGGCSGFSYDLHFDNKTTKNDIVVTKFGLTAVADKEVMSFAAGTVINYVEGLSGSGFKVENPSSHGGCGCGKSFN